MGKCAEGGRAVGVQQTCGRRTCGGCAEGGRAVDVRGRAVGGRVEGVQQACGERTCGRRTCEDRFAVGECADGVRGAGMRGADMREQMGARQTCGGCARDVRMVDRMVIQRHSEANGVMDRWRRWANDLKLLIAIFALITRIKSLAYYVYWYRRIIRRSCIYQTGRR